MKLLDRKPITKDGLSRSEYIKRQAQIQTGYDFQGFHHIATIASPKSFTIRIDLLMTDVVMPEMNGLDLARQLTSLYPDIKLLFMSGYTDNMIAHHGVLDEGVAFIQKPFSIKDLADKVRRVLAG